jgi:eukaryotic-like serine/threonine-protein kinase
MPRDRATPPAEALIAGRYLLCDEIGVGGMASVHLGRLYGSAGFARTVAIKRLHAQYAKDADFVPMFMDEAWLASRIRHPSVIPTLDVVKDGPELFLVMEYVPGTTLLHLLRAADAVGEGMPPAIAVAIFVSALHGLHAAHEAVSETGAPLHLVHRDVSLSNVLVGTDGVARMLDFGVAKAAGRLQTTRDGQIKGKAAYMSPEQLRGHDVDRRTDTYAAAVTIWEALTLRRLFLADSPAATMTRVLEDEVRPPSAFAGGIPPALDAVVMKGLERAPERRWQTAVEMADALAASLPAASPSAVSAWVLRIDAEALRERASLVTKVESGTDVPSAPAKSLPRVPNAVLVDTDILPPKKPSIAMPILVAAALALGVSAVAGALVLRGRKAAAAAQAVVAGPTSSSPEPRPSASVAAVESAVAPPAETAAASADSAPARARAPRTVKRPGKPEGTRPSKRDCDPAYRIDENGIRRPKPECL